MNKVVEWIVVNLVTIANIIKKVLNVLFDDIFSMKKLKLSKNLKR